MSEALIGESDLNESGKSCFGSKIHRSFHVTKQFQPNRSDYDTWIFQQLDEGWESRFPNSAKNEALFSPGASFLVLLEGRIHAV